MKTCYLVLSLLLIALQLRLWAGEGSLAEVHQLERQIALQEAENERLLIRNDLLRAEVVDLRNSVGSIEERARSELGMIRSGETFFLLVPGAPDAGG